MATAVALRAAGGAARAPLWLGGRALGVRTLHASPARPDDEQPSPRQQQLAATAAWRNTGGVVAAGAALASLTGALMAARGLQLACALHALHKREEGGGGGGEEERKKKRKQKKRKLNEEQEGGQWSLICLLSLCFSQDLEVQKRKE